MKRSVIMLVSLTAFGCASRGDQTQAEPEMPKEDGRSLRATTV